MFSKAWLIFKVFCGVVGHALFADPITFATWGLVATAVVTYRSGKNQTKLQAERWQKEDEARRDERRERWGREDRLSAIERQPACGIELMRYRNVNNALAIRCVNLGINVFYVEELRLKVEESWQQQKVDGPVVLQPGGWTDFRLSYCDDMQMMQRSGEVVALVKSSDGEFTSRPAHFYFWHDSENVLELRVGLAEAGRLVNFAREIDDPSVLQIK